MCTKLSGLAMLVGVGIAGCVASRRRRAPRWSLVAPLPLALLLGFCARRAILTGWVLYPVPFGDLHLPWSVPAARVLNEYHWIQSWARMPRVAWEQVLGGSFFHWFQPWFEVFRGTHACTLLVASACLVAARLCLRGPITLAERCALLAGSASLLYWFTGAPDLRFGAVFFWIFFAAAAVSFLSSGRDAARMVVILSIALMSWHGGFDLRLTRSPSWTQVDPVPELPLRVVDLRQPDGGNLRVWSPKSGDLCGDAPLPCTPQVGSQRMRRPNQLSAGFLPN